MKQFPNVSAAMDLAIKHGWNINDRYYEQVIESHRRKLKEIHLNLEKTCGQKVKLSILRSKSAMHGDWLDDEQSLHNLDFEVAFIYPGNTIKMEGYSSLERLEELLLEFDAVFPSPRFCTILFCVRMHKAFLVKKSLTRAIASRFNSTRNTS
jgi:hypothetical protein